MSRPWLALTLVLFCLPLFFGLRSLDLETDEQPAQFGRGIAGIAVHAVAAVAGLQLVAPHPGAAAIEKHQLGSIRNSGVRAGAHAARFEIRAHALLDGEVDLGHVVDAGAPCGPFAVKRLCHFRQRFLSAAMVAHQDDVAESGSARACRDVARHGGKCSFRNTDASGKAHMASPCRGIAGRRERHHRIHQRVAEARRNPSRHVARNDVVLARYHVRTVLLGAAGVVNCGVRPGGDRIAHFRPGQFLDVDRRRGGQRR